MPFKRIDKEPWGREKKCRHPEHEPPGMIVLEDGIYEYTCPACGAVKVVAVHKPTMKANNVTEVKYGGLANVRRKSGKR